MKKKKKKKKPSEKKDDTSSSVTQSEEECAVVLNPAEVLKAKLAKAKPKKLSAAEEAIKAAEREASKKPKLKKKGDADYSY